MGRIVKEKIYIDSPNGKLKLIVLKPADTELSGDSRTGILWIHGGGYATGMASMVYMSRALPLVKKYGAVVVAPEYTLSAKKPYPAALEECYAALCYMSDNCKKLGFARENLMVGGESAGGGLTAALSLYARDKGGPHIAFQMPLYPMIDNQDTPSSVDNHGISWNTKRNRAAWKLYLRGIDTEEVPPYAAPAREKDCSGLPPAYTFVGDREAFYCETVDFIDRLNKAGVEAELDVYPSGFHAFDMLLPFLKISKAAAARFESKYLDAVKRYCVDTGETE